MTVDGASCPTSVKQDSTVPLAVCNPALAALLCNVYVVCQLVPWHQHTTDCQRTSHAMRCFMRAVADILTDIFHGLQVSCHSPPCSQSTPLFCCNCKGTTAELYHRTSRSNVAAAELNKVHVQDAPPVLELTHDVLQMEDVSPQGSCEQVMGAQHKRPGVQSGVR